MKAHGFFARNAVSSPRAALMAAAVVGLASCGFASSAWAGCQEDIAAINQKRLTQVSALNADAKKLKGKLNPITACPQLRSLASLEKQLTDYMVKNKEWCAIPDEVVSNIQSSAAKTATIAGQACAAVGKMKEMERKAKEQQAQGFGNPGPQKLPTGPL